MNLEEICGKPTSSLALQLVSGLLREKAPQTWVDVQTFVCQLDEVRLNRTWNDGLLTYRQGHNIYSLPSVEGPSPRLFLDTALVIVGQHAAKELLQVRQSLGGGLTSEVRDFEQQQHDQMQAIRRNIEQSLRIMDAQLKVAKDGFNLDKILNPNSWTVTMSDLQSVFSQAQENVDLLSRLGVDRSGIAAAKRFLGVGTALFTAVVQFETHNYVAGVKSLFAAWGLIQGGFASNDENRTNEAMAQALQSILRAIEDLTQRFEYWSQEVVLRLEELGEDQLFNRRLTLASGIATQLNQAEFFLDTRRDFDLAYSPYGFSAFRFAEAHCKANCVSYYQGRAGLESLFTSRKIHELFLRQTYEGQSLLGEGTGLLQRGSLRERVYDPLFTHTRTVAEANGIDHIDVLSSFLTHSATVSDIQDKVLRLRAGDLGISHWLKDLQDKSPFDLAMEGLLHAPAIDRASKILIDFLPYYEWVESPVEGRFFQEAASLLGSLRWRLPRAMLLRALHLVDIARAQQALLSGDALLPFLARTWRPPKSLTEAERLGDLAIRIDTETGSYRASSLSCNEILSSNLLLFSLVAQMSPDSLLRYHLAKDPGVDSNELSRLFQPVSEAQIPWNFVKLTVGEHRTPSGKVLPLPCWAVELETLWHSSTDRTDRTKDKKLYLPLPSIRELSQRRLRTTAAQKSLDALRSAITSELIAIDYSTSATDRTSLYPLLLLGTAMR